MNKIPCFEEQLKKRGEEDSLKKKHPESQGLSDHSVLSQTH